MSKQRVIVNISALFVLYILLKGCWLFAPRIFEALELHAQDSILRIAHSFGISQKISPDIVYIDLDENSLAKLPYSANNPQLYADIISILKKAGVAVQIIDILFVSDSPPDMLIQSSRDAGNVYLPLILDTSGGAQNTVQLPRPAAWKKETGSSLAFPQGSLSASAQNSVNEAAAGLGHINCQPDYDGVYRRLPLFFLYNSYLIPPISLRAVSDYLQVVPENLKIGEGRLTLSNAVFPNGRVVDIVIPFDRAGKSRIHFTGPWPHVFAHYSFAKILDMGSSPEGLMELRDELEGTLAVLSDVTTGGRDFGPVPFASYSPLSELHVQFLNSVLTNTFIREATFGQILFLELFILALLIVMMLKMTGYKLMGVTCLLTLALIALVSVLYISFHMIYPVILPSILLTLGATGTLLIEFIYVQQEKKLMKERLTRYFAPSVMDKILTSPEMVQNVSKKELTILFSDIVGFTAWSSEQEASDVHETLNRYFREMSRIVFSFEGTIDKFMGDGMLAFFGDPIPQENHPERAVLAALAMQRKAWELKKEWEQTGGMRIRIRIGIHTGEVVVGDMGSEERMDYTVIGSHVNLSQRLESNCAPDRIMISQDVHERLDDRFITSSSGIIHAKGFKETIKVYYVDRFQPHQSQTI